PLYGALIEQAIMDQVGNGADLQAMLLGEGFQFGAAGHAAVLVHDFADYPGLAKATHARQITGSFGMTGTGQYATGLSHQREDMTRADDILGHRIRRGGRLHSSRAVSSGDAGGNTFSRLDRPGVLG